VEGILSLWTNKLEPQFSYNDKCGFFLSHNLCQALSACDFDKTRHAAMFQEPNPPLMISHVLARLLLFPRHALTCLISGLCFWIPIYCGVCCRVRQRLSSRGRWRCRFWKLLSSPLEFTPNTALTSRRAILVSWVTTSGKAPVCMRVRG